MVDLDMGSYGVGNVIVAYKLVGIGQIEAVDPAEIKFAVRCRQRCTVAELVALKAVVFRIATFNGVCRGVETEYASACRYP